MTWIIDSHEDIAWNALTLKRDLRRSAAETRQLEAGTPHPQWNGDTMLGYPDYQRGQVALVFGTLFMAPKAYQTGEWDWMVFRDAAGARQLYQQQVDVYRRMCETAPDMFRLVCTQTDLAAVLAPWEQAPANFPDRTLPVGIVMLMEGAEGIDDPEEMEEWWQAGVRLCGPVWAGTRFCGGMRQPGEFTREGYHLLEVLARLGYILDVSHMSPQSVLQSLDHYPGAVVATHANALSLIRGANDWLKNRHLADEALRGLIQRDGIVGVLPANEYLAADWKKGDDRSRVTLDMVAAQIDYICQLAGDALHVGIGTDFDGGFGYPDVPLELETIADLPRLAPFLSQRGYTTADIAQIFGGNWRRMLAAALPAER